MALPHLRHLAQQAQQVLQAPFQQMVPVEQEPAQPQLLERRPHHSPEEEKAVMDQVLLVSPDVNRRWLRHRAGYGPEFLVNFIFENYDRIPLEPAATKQRIMNVSLASEEGSFLLNQDELDEQEVKQKKIDALIVFIKQRDNRREEFPRDFNEYVKRRYPTIRCQTITHLKNKARDLEEVFAVCELIAMKAVTQAVSAELHMPFLTQRGGIPWLDMPSSIKARKKLAPLPAVGRYLDAHQEISRLLQAVGPNPPEVTCAICYDDFSKKRSIPCCEDEDDDNVHYVCFECLRGQGRALCTDGQLAEGGQGFKCVDPGCKNVLPWANVKKFLEKDVRKVLSKRQDNEAVLALEGLESCNYCSFQMLIEASTDELKVFSCQKCRAEFCRICKKDWKDHMGRKCDEMKSVEDKKDEARKKLEEELAMAVMRKCHRCKVVFSKSEGCNKMTCRCGATQCYMCRKEDIHYDHFCPHPRDPKEPGVCPSNCPAKCLLWVETSDVDNAALKSVKDKAAMDRELHDLVNQLK